MPGGSFAWRRLTEYFDEVRDLFGGDTVNTITDLIDVPGEHDFTPERLRYYKDGSRRFLQYGDDANYTEAARGRTLAPDSGQTLTMETAERAAYPVGSDLWPSMSYSVNQAPQAGDAVGGGFGIIDLANFQPEDVSYAAGSDADGWFWYHTADTGLDEVILAGVGDGSIYYAEQTSTFNAASVLSIMETRLNWYGVGPGKYIRSYTNIEDYPDEPNRNKVLGYVANDDGPSSLDASHRATLAVHQASGNSGLELMSGSMSVKASADPNYQFKRKGHQMSLENTNTTVGTYQVLGAIRGQNSRPEVKLRIPGFTITKTPGSGVTRTKVLMMAVSPENTNADDAFPTPHEDAVPKEHNSKNSVVEEVSVAGDAATPLTGPIEDDAGTDVTGATTSNTIINPGGYQIGRQSINPEGVGSNLTALQGSQVGLRNLYDTDIALILVDATTAGTVELDVLTGQNS